MALFERAVEVIPGGIYGHTSPVVNLPCASPYFASSAEGCRYKDVDGHTYIDYMCGYGPIILGHQDERVDRAASEQKKQGQCFNHPSVQLVELAERLVQQVDFADWAVFGKNGSDMTTWSIQLAREYTGCRKVLAIEGAYHGKDPWCTPGHAGLIEEDRMHVHRFLWNDLEGWQNLLKQHRGDIAALIITPYHHPSYAESIMPAAGFLQKLEADCKAHGIVLILDDVRAGFRLHAGGSHQYFDFTPDIACYSKAIANGYPLSAAVGKARFKAIASKVFLTGSFWNNPVPMAAALETLSIIKEDKIPEKLEVAGKQLCSGLEALGEAYGYVVRCTGPVSMPFLRFGSDRGFHQQQSFCRKMMELGVFFHPHHNWFLCEAHDASTIAETLNKAKDAFQYLQKSKL